jgi:hypothetical protein
MAATPTAGQGGLDADLADLRRRMERPGAPRAQLGLEAARRVRAHIDAVLETGGPDGPRIASGLSPLLADLALQVMAEDASLPVRQEALLRLSEAGRLLSQHGDVRLLEPQLTEARPLILAAAAEAESAETDVTAARILYGLCAVNQAAGRLTTALQIAVQVVRLLESAYNREPRPERAQALLQVLVAQDGMAREAAGVQRPSAKVLAHVLGRTVGLSGEALKPVAGLALQYWSTLELEDADLFGRALQDRLQAERDTDPAATAWIAPILGVLDGSTVRAMEEAEDS